MSKSQARSSLALETRWVGRSPPAQPYPPAPQGRPTPQLRLPSGGHLSHARALGVLLRNIALNDRQPLYTHAEWAARAEPSLIGLEEGQAALLNDDRVGRALDRLFDADRAALLTELVVGAIKEFTIDLDQLHNELHHPDPDRRLQGSRRRRGSRKATVLVTYGHNKDHRPDLKQLLFVLSVSAGRCRPHPLQGLGWQHQRLHYAHRDREMLRKLAGEAGLSVCGRLQALFQGDPHPHRSSSGEVHHALAPKPSGGTGLRPTFSPTAPWRRQSADQSSSPAGPEDVWKVVQAELPSKRTHPIVWVWNSMMARRTREPAGPYREGLSGD